ncbi:MAG: DUF4880 domain-containing protein [Alphaproteobacteria bacterium]|nr:DUF4880 domain-containing protein [Alphaproteobacteria bacterium]
MSENREDAGQDPANRRTEEALLWFTRMQGAGATGADRAAFEAWLAADSRNGASFRRVTALWGSPELAAALEVAALGAEARPARHSTAAAWPFLRYAAVAAAVLACVALFGPLAGAWRYLGADYRTAAGATRTVTLADGSVLRLNTATAIEVEMGDAYRRVRLLRGEGYFDVARNADRPFEVDAGPVHVRILGTAFTVQRDGDRVLVGVRRGSVTVYRGDGVGTGARLSAGEMLEIAPGEPARRARFDADTMLAWLDGRIVFRDKPLGAVMEQVGRYHPGWIFLAGDDLAKARVSGSFRLDDPGAIVDSLARAAAAEAVRLPGGIIVVH